MIDLLKLGVSGETAQIQADRAFKALNVEAEVVVILNKYTPMLMDLSQELLTLLIKGAANQEYEEEI